MIEFRWQPVALALSAVLSLVAALSPADTTTRPAGQPQPPQVYDMAAQAREQFVAFCREVGDPQDTSPDLQRAPTWLRAANGNWIFTIDLTGNRSLRRLGVQARTAVTPPYAAARLREKPWVSSAVRDKLTEQTRRLAEALAQVRESDGSAHLKQEVVLICRRDKAEVRRYAGRYLVRLNGLPHGAYFQVLYGPDQKPVRVETNVRDPVCARLADAIADPAQKGGMTAYRETRGPLVFGTFFYPTHTHFELNAYSYEGEDFLNVSQRQNPFAHDHFVADPAYPPQTAAYHRSQDYRRWCWAWWDSCGRVGAIRGNWDPQAGQWEYPGIKIQFHRSLADYPLKGGEPRETHKYPMPDGKEHEFPFATAEEFTPLFYQDLERCQVVYITTHGGNLGRRFRLQRDLDVWVKFGPPQEQGLGGGSLRHLFFEGCGGMTYLAEGDRDILTDTWLRSNFIQGIRTISGSDGGHTALDRSGWHFYGRYNKGDSIGDAWALGNLDENVENNPVTIAYGQTRQESIETLVAGRFTTGRTDAKWAAVSLWDEAGAAPLPAKASGRH